MYNICTSILLSITIIILLGYYYALKKGILAVSYIKKKNFFLLCTQGSCDNNVYSV